MMLTEGTFITVTDMQHNSESSRIEEEKKKNCQYSFMVNHKHH